MQMIYSCTLCLVTILISLVKLLPFECCIEDLMAWMRSNLLKVNSDKTEFILFRTRFSSSLSPSPIGCLRSLNIPPYIKSLGVYFDSTMSMSKQVNNIAKSCYFHIRNIARIRKYLSFKSCEILVQAFVISRLDYCNSLLHALPHNIISRLQRI